MRKIRSKHCNNRFNRSSPHGVSLIEMLVMISLMSVIFTVGVTMLAFLMRVELQGTDRIQHTFNLQKLSNQFREDAGAASKASVIAKENPKQQILKLELDSNTFIVYSTGKNAHRNFIIREKNSSDQPVTRNEYPIADFRLHFHIENINQRQIVSLQLKVLPDESHDNITIKMPFKELDFDAVINQKYSYAIQEVQ